MTGEPFSSPIPTIVSVLAAAAVASAAQRDVDFNDGWRFAVGDPADVATVEFDDADWQTVRLPHDCAIAGPFNPNESGRTGKLP